MYHWEANWYEDSRNFESPCPPSFGFLFDSRTQSEFDTVKLVELHSDIFADRSKGVLLLKILFVSLSSLWSRVCFCSLAVTTWERADLWLSCVLCSLVFCNFPIWCSGSGKLLDLIDSWSLPSSLREGVTLTISRLPRWDQSWILNQWWGWMMLKFAYCITLSCFWMVQAIMWSTLTFSKPLLFKTYDHLVCFKVFFVASH